VRSSGMWATWRLIAARGFWLAMSSPLINTRPLVHLRNPVNHLCQFALPVAGDPGHADDFACPHLHRELAQGLQAAVVFRADPFHGEYDLAGLCRPLLDGENHVAADHELGQLRLRCAPASSPAAVTWPCRSTVTRLAMANTSSSLWLMKTMEWPRASIDRSVAKKVINFQGRQDRRSVRPKIRTLGPR